MQPFDIPSMFGFSLMVGTAEESQSEGQLSVF